MNSFDKLLTEISWLYEKGYPDFSIKEDREALYDYLLSIGFPHSDVIELSERFIREKEESEYTHKGRGIYVKTADKDNDNATKYKKDGDNYVAVDSDDDKKKKKSDKVTDFSRDGEQPKDEPKDKKFDDVHTFRCYCKQ